MRLTGAKSAVCAFIVVLAAAAPAHAWWQGYYRGWAYGNIYFPYYGTWGGYYGSYPSWSSYGGNAPYYYYAPPCYTYSTRSPRVEYGYAPPVVVPETNVATLGTSGSYH